MTNHTETIRPFTTDGCSGGLTWLWGKLFAAGIVSTARAPWYGCCVAHDRPYWDAGSASGMTRREADRQLRQCVADRGWPLFAWVVYVGVRVGGSDWLPTPWRWGYGYPMRRKSWVPLMIITALLALLIWG